MIYREPVLHLAVNENFTYLNYLSLMSAIRGNNIVLWHGEKEPDNKYWDLVKKVRSITFRKLDPIGGLTAHPEDKISRLDAIYLGELSKDYVKEYTVVHTGLYDPEQTGEFETKDMTIVKVTKPELITPEFIKSSGTLLAALIKRVLFERVWNQ